MNKTVATATMTMIFIVTLLCSCITGTVAANHGAAVSGGISSGRDRRRRRLNFPLLEEGSTEEDQVDCVLYIRADEYVDEEDGGEVWCCEFTDEQGDIMFEGNTMIRLGGVPNEAFEERGAMSGMSLLKIQPNATVFVDEYVDDDTAETELVIEFDEEDVSVAVEPMAETDARMMRARRLASSAPGTVLTTLVVRIIDAAQGDKGGDHHHDVDGGVHDQHHVHDESHHDVHESLRKHRGSQIGRAHV